MTKIRFLRPFVLLLVVVAVLVLAPGAGAARSFRVGLMDDGAFLYGNPKAAFRQARRLHVQVVRITLHWGGRLGVAQRRPRHASSPYDRAYHWQLYDRAVQYANQYGLRVMFTIVDTRRVRARSFSARRSKRRTRTPTPSAGCAPSGTSASIAC